jgi:hypothetical protein
MMGSDPDSPGFMLTAGLTIRYRRPVPIGQPLQLLGRGLGSSGRRAEAWGGIYLVGHDPILAEGTVKLVATREGIVPKDRLEALGWRIYPEQATDL